MPIPIKRIALLQPGLSGYLLACMQQLKSLYDLELLIFHWEPRAEAPFQFGALDWADQVQVRDGQSVAQILETVRAFGPDGLYIPGWIDRGYFQVARALKKQGIPVVAGLDNQPNGSLRQRLAAKAAPRYLHPTIDALWVAGERQAQLAQRFGYAGERCWRGFYCCDWDKFAAPRPAAPHQAAPQKPSFFYSGRYVAEKGIEDLVTAYRAYRAQVAEPWELHCVGTGALKTLLEKQPGIVVTDFVQPNALPALMQGHSAFVLPSRNEPWGVVLQEAAAAGLPLIASDACGAAVHLLQDGYNGFSFERGNAAHLTKCLLKLSALSPERRQEMGRASHELSKQFTPTRWARTLVEGLQGLQKP